MAKLKINAVQTAALLVILTLISKFVGFFREMIMANYYGTSYIADAYQMAIAIPNMVLGGIFGAISVAYMPLFSKKIESEGQEAGNRFTSALMNILMIAGVITAILGFFFSDLLVSLIARGFEGEKAALTVFYLKISFTFIFFTSLGGVVEAYLRYKGAYLAPVISGYMQNVGMITIIIVSAYTDHHLLIFGLFLGLFLKLLAELLFAKKNEFQYYFTLRSDKVFRQIAKLSIPVFIGSSVNQISNIVDKSLASGLPDGRVAALSYGLLIVGLISGLTVTIFTTMVYPKLAQAASLGEYDRLSDLLGLGIALITLIAVPCTLGGMFYSEQIVQVIFERGAFDPNSTGITSTAFFYYVIGLTFSATNTLMVYCFYSMHDTKTPVKVGVIAVCIDIILNFILIGYLEHGGLALSTSIGSIANTVFLYTALRKKHPEITIIKSRRKIAKIIIASIISVGASLLSYYFIIMPIKDIIYPRLIQLGLAVLVAGVVYYILLKLMKIEEVGLIRQLFMKNK